MFKLLNFEDQDTALLLLKARFNQVAIKDVSVNNVFDKDVLANDVLAKDFLAKEESDQGPNCRAGWCQSGLFR